MRKIAVILLLSFAVLVIILITQYIRFSDKKLHVIFCNVGQGDAVLIRTPQNLTVLFDAGPDNKVVKCLSNHMALWDKSIEYAILSHPHADHFVGFIDVLKHYSVRKFSGEHLVNPSPEYNDFLLSLKKNNLTISNLYSGDKITTSDGIMIEVLGPTKEYLSHTSPQGMIGESDNFASLHLRISYKDFEMHLTGDNQSEQIADDIEINSSGRIDVMQVPHHGSKTGLNDKILDRLKPKLALISVGRNNYGHPHPTILELLKKHNVSHKRTDQLGTIEVVTDGKSIEVRSGS